MWGEITFPGFWVSMFLQTDIKDVVNGQMRDSSLPELFEIWRACATLTQVPEPPARLNNNSVSRCSLSTGHRFDQTLRVSTTDAVHMLSQEATQSATDFFLSSAEQSVTVSEGVSVIRLAVPRVRLFSGTAS